LPINAIGYPAHPLTFEALTMGNELMVIVMPLEVAVVGLAQVAEEVKTQVTICPFSMDELVYVGLFVPTFTPSNFH